MKLLNITGKVLLTVLSLILAVILTLFLLYILTSLQEKLFLPETALYFILKPPYSMFFLLLELEILTIFFYFLSKDFNLLLSYLRKKLEAQNRHWKKYTLGAAVLLNFVVLYLMVVNVSVLTENGISDHTTFHPIGTFHPYESLVSIDAGIKGEKRESLAFQGEFFYQVTLLDGKVLDLARMGGSRSEEDFRFLLNRLDQKLIAYGIPKDTSTEKLPYLYETLDPLYVNTIEEILTRTE